MPIYEQTYRKWEGVLDPKPRTWLVIGRTGIQMLWKKGMIILTLLASIAFFFRAVQIYLVSRVGESHEVFDMIKGLKIDPDFFLAYLNGQNFFLMLILILAGSGLIANDRRFKALLLYFSKPLSMWDYLAGKFSIVTFYGSLITLLPALLLYILKILLSTDILFFNTYWWLPFSILALAGLMVSVYSITILTLSALSKNTRLAAIFFFAVLTVPDIFQKILSRIPEVGMISLRADIRQIAAVLFKADPPADFSTWYAAGFLALYTAACILILRLKTHPTEVVQ